MSLRALRDCGVASPVVVVPDSVAGILRSMPDLADAARLDAVRASLGVEGPYVVVQANRDAAPAVDAFAAASDERPTMVAIEIAPTLGDDLRLVTERHHDAVPAALWPDVEAMVTLIAGAQGAIGLSLHLATVALAAGVPVLRPGGFAAGKYAPLFDRPGVHSLDGGAGRDLAAFLDALRAPRTAPSAPSGGEPELLDRHWADLAEALGAPRPPTPRAAALANAVLLDAMRHGEAAATAAGRAEEAAARRRDLEAQVALLRAQHAAAELGLHAAEDRERALEARLAAQGEQLGSTWRHAAALEAELAAVTARERARRDLR